MIRYIYKITNNINGHMYIGQHSTKNINDGYMGSGYALRAAFKKYGKENFNKDIIAYVNGTKKELDHCEKFFIRHYRNKFGKDMLYNIADGGNGGNMGEEWYKKYAEGCHTEKWRQTMSDKFSGDKNPFYGKKHSEETRKKLKDFSNQPDELKRRSERVKGSNNPMYGKKLSEERKKKISEKSKSLWNNEEYRKKTSESMKRCWGDEEYRAKRSKSIKQFWKDNPEKRKEIGDRFRGKPKSEETKRKMSENNARYWHYHEVSQETREKKSKASSGHKNPRAKKLSIDGEVYECMKYAAQKYGVSKNTMMKWIKQKKHDAHYI